MILSKSSFQRLMVIVILVFQILLAAVVYVNQKIARDYKREAGESLTTIVATKQKALKYWLDLHRTNVQHWAKSPEIVAASEQLLSGVSTKQALLASQAQVQLRQWYLPMPSGMGLFGYFVVDKNLINRASSRDANVGGKNLLWRQPGFYQKIWQGHSAISAPLISDTPLTTPTEHADESLENVSMFVGAPIYNDNAEIVAALLFRLSPVREFSAMLSPNLGDMQAQTYAVDAKGWLLSASARNHQALHLSGEHTGHDLMSRLRIADPGVNLLKEEKPSLPQGQWPLTWAVENLVSGSSGSNLEGYRDARGVEVVGAWVWDNELGFGLVTEVDADTIFKQVTLGKLISVILIVVLLLLAVGALLVTLGRRRIVESEKMLRNIIDNVPAMISVRDHDGNVLLANQVLARAYGTSLIDVVKKPMPETVVQYDRDSGQQQISQKVLSQGKTQQVPAQYFKTAGQQQLVLQTTAIPFRYHESDKYDSVLVVSADITEQQKAELEIEKSHQQYRLLFEKSNDGVFILKDGLVHDCNERFAELLGTEKSKVIGESILAFSPLEQVNGGNSSQWLAEVVQTIDVDASRLFQWRFNLRAGAYIDLEINLSKVDMGEGEVLLAACRDISQRLRMEEEKESLHKQLLQSQKMEALGHLTGGMAHDFNNILASILGFGDLIRELYAKNEPSGRLLKYTEQILNSGNRAKALIKQMLAFSRGEIGDEQLIRPNTIISEAVEMLRPTIASSIEISTTIDSGEELFIRTDPVQLHQVILNLIINARDAIKNEKGSISIALGLAGQAGQYCSSCQKKFVGDYVHLVVSDNGQGIEQAVLARIFEPFFTTKSVGKGTGMGLAVVHGIVHASGGHIAISSTPGEGTRVELYFPQISASREELDSLMEAEELREQQQQKIKIVSPEKSALTNASGEGLARAVTTEVDKQRNQAVLGKVMVVDDEPAIIHFLSDALSSNGYEVVSFERSQDAMAFFNDKPGAFDFIVTDQVMPEVTGTDLAERMLEQRPDLPIILCSGYSESLNEEDIKKIGISAFMPKPIDVNELLNIMRSV